MKSNSKIIPTAALLTMGTMVLASINKEEGLPKMSEIVGFLVVFTVLSAGQDFDIPVVGAMAVMFMIVIMLERGPEALGFIVDQLDEKTKKAKEGPKGPQGTRGKRNRKPQFDLRSV